MVSMETTLYLEKQKLEDQRQLLRGN